MSFHAIVSVPNVLELKDIRSFRVAIMMIGRSISSTYLHAQQYLINNRRVFLQRKQVRFEDPQGKARLQLQGQRQAQPDAV
eukprot:6331967-Amphidinium_carterae.1